MVKALARRVGGTSELWSSAGKSEEKTPQLFLIQLLHIITRIESAFEPSGPSGALISGFIRNSVTAIANEKM